MDEREQLRSIISDYRGRSEAIEKSIGATVRRIKLLEATVPALMIWRKWRNEGRVPQLDIDELINKQIALRKQIKAAESEEKQKFFEEFKVAKSETSMDSLNNKIESLRRLQRYIIQEKMIKKKINELEEKQQSYKDALEQLINPQKKLPCADQRKHIPFPIKQISPEPCYCDDPCECESCRLIPRPDQEEPEEPQEIGLVTGPSLNSLHDIEMMTEEPEEEEDEDEGEGEEGEGEGAEKEGDEEPPKEEGEEAEASESEEPGEGEEAEAAEGEEPGEGGDEEPPPPDEPEETDWSAILEDTPKLNFKEAATKLTSVFETLKAQYRGVDCNLLGTLRDLSKFISVTAELVPQEVIEQAMQRGEEEPEDTGEVQDEGEGEEHVCSAVKYMEGIGVIIEEDESAAQEEVVEEEEEEEVVADEEEMVEEEEEEEPTGVCNCGAGFCPAHGGFGSEIQEEPSLLSNFEMLLDDLKAQKAKFGNADMQCQCNVECGCEKCTNRIPMPDIVITDRQQQQYEPCDSCDCDACVCNIVCQANVLTNMAKTIPCSNSREIPPPPDDLQSLPEASVEGSITTIESEQPSEEIEPSLESEQVEEVQSESKPSEAGEETVEEEIVDDKPWKHKTDDQLTAEDLAAMACKCDDCQCTVCPDRKSPTPEPSPPRAESPSRITEPSESLGFDESLAEESKAPSEAGGEPTGGELEVSIAEESKGDGDMGDEETLALSLAEETKASTVEGGDAESGLVTEGGEEETLEVSVAEESAAPTEGEEEMDISMAERSEVEGEPTGEEEGAEESVAEEEEEGEPVSEKPSLLSNFEKLYDDLVKLKKTIPVEGDEVACQCNPCECSPCLGHVAPPDVDVTDRQRQIYEPCDNCDCGDVGGPCMCNIICQYNVLHKLAEEIPCVNYDHFFGDHAESMASEEPCTCGAIGSCHCLCKICPCSKCNMLMDKCAAICGETEMGPTGPQPCDCGLPCICKFCPDNKCQCDPCIECPDCPDRERLVGAEDFDVSQGGADSPGTSSMDRDMGSSCTCLAPIEESVREIFKNKACKCAAESEAAITPELERSRSGAEQVVSSGGRRCSCLKRVEQNVRAMFKNESCQCPDPFIKESEYEMSNRRYSTGGASMTKHASGTLPKQGSGEYESTARRSSTGGGSLTKQDSASLPKQGSGTLPKQGSGEYESTAHRNSTGGGSLAKQGSGLAKRQSGVRFTKDDEDTKEEEDTNGPTVCVCEPCISGLKGSKVQMEIDEVVEKHRHVKPSVIVVVAPNRYFAECSSHIIGGTGRSSRSVGQRDACCQPCDSTYTIEVDMAIDCSNAQKEPISVETEQRINMHCKNSNCPCCKPCRCNCKRSCM